MALPGGYQQVAYIESSGTQYIDADVSATITDTLSAEVDALVLNPESDSSFAGLCGCSTSTRQFFIAKKQDSYKMYFGCNAGGNVLYTETNPTANERHTHKIERTATASNVYLDGQQVFTDSSISFANVPGIGLFALKNESSYYGYAQAKMFSAKITKNGTLVRDYVPALQESDGSIGLYDLVNNEFYGNAGTGAFTAGPVVGPVGSRALLEGTAYEITGGSAMVDGTVYAIAGGKTLVDGTVYDIPFDDGMATITITGFLNNFEYCGALRIDGTNYLSETTLELPVGTVIHCCTREWDIGGTHLNGTKVSSLVHAPIDVYFYGQYYAFVVEGDAAIRLQNPCNIYITT